MPNIPLNIPFHTQLTGIRVGQDSEILRVQDVDPVFANLNDGSALLYRMLSIFRKEDPATQPRFDWFEDDILATKVTFDGSYNNSATTITFKEDDVVVPNSTIYVVATGEILRVVSRTNSKTFVVARGHQGTTAAAISDGSVGIVKGATLAEYATANLGVSNLPERKFNYVEFFSQSFRVSELQESTIMLGGTGQTDREFRKQTLSLMQQMDNAIRWGKKAIDTTSSSSGTMYYTDGLASAIQTNDITIPQNPTWQDLNALLNPLFAYTGSSPVKTLILGQAAFSILNNIAFSRYSTPPKFEEVLGAVMTRLVLDGGGTLDIVVDKYGFPPGGTNPASLRGFILDMKYVGLKEMRGWELRWRDISPRDGHWYAYEVYGSVALRLQLEKLHAKVKFTP